VTGEVTYYNAVMKHFIGGLAFVFLLPILSGSAPHVTVDSAPDAEAVRAAHVEWTKAWAAKDVDAIVRRYADDADIELADASIIRGNGNIRLGIKRAFADPAFTLTMTTDRVEVSKAGDLAFARGTYTKTVSDAATKRPVTTRGEYLVVYRSDGHGGWRAIHDISNRGPV
jgi:ketosteroid isomerase-like protein